MSNFYERVIGAAKLDVKIYEEVEADTMRFAKGGKTEELTNCVSCHN